MRQAVKSPSFGAYEGKAGKWELTALCVATPAVRGGLVIYAAKYTIRTRAAEGRDYGSHNLITSRGVMLEGTKAVSTQGLNTRTGEGMEGT